MNITKEFHFEAAHVLPRHQGKCSREHGHSWRVVVEVGGMVDKATGFVLDYAELKKLVQPIIDRFDHQHLNAFVQYPSSENIAIHIAHLLRPSLDYGTPEAYYVVRVSETQTSWAAWDSRSAYCMQIFDQGLLDSEPNAMDAEWRAPAVDHVTNVPEMIELLEDRTAEDLANFIKRNARLQQLKLYRDSMQPSKIYEQLKAYDKSTFGPKDDEPVAPFEVVVDPRLVEQYERQIDCLTCRAVYEQAKSRQQFFTQDALNILGESGHFPYVDHPIQKKVTAK